VCCSVLHKASRHATPFRPGTGKIAACMLSCVMVCCVLFVVMCCVLCVACSGVFSQVQQSNTHQNTLHHTTPHCYTLFCRLERGQPRLHLEAQHALPSNTHCNTPQHTATHSNTLQHTATHCNTLHRTATHCNTLQHTATHCNTLFSRLKRGQSQNQFEVQQSLPSNTLQHTATHCNTLHRTATHHTALQHTTQPARMWTSALSPGTSKITPK